MMQLATMVNTEQKYDVPDRLTLLELAIAETAKQRNELFKKFTSDSLVVTPKWLKAANAIMDKAENENGQD